MDSSSPEFVAVVYSFTVGVEQFDTLVREATALLEPTLQNTDGLISTMFFRNEDRTMFWVISYWRSLERWSAARWDEKIDQTLTALVETAKIFRVETLWPILEFDRRINP